MPLPEDYMAALLPLARAFTSYRAWTGFEAILVGGAATAIYTAGAFPSGDFDVVASSDDDFTKAMLEQGFVAEHRAMHLLFGFYHPDHPGYGFQQVSGALFDGKADRKRLVHIAVQGADTVVLPSIEDMIADRLGQYASSFPDDSRLQQARALFLLADNLDMTYLRKRICDESGDPELLVSPFR